METSNRNSARFIHTDARALSTVSFEASSTATQRLLSQPTPVALGVAVAPQAPAHSLHLGPTLLPVAEEAAPAVAVGTHLRVEQAVCVRVAVVVAARRLRCSNKTGFHVEIEQELYVLVRWCAHLGSRSRFR